MCDRSESTHCVTNRNGSMSSDSISRFTQQHGYGDIRVYEKKLTVIIV